jgi:hypothetical protein
MKKNQSYKKIIRTLGPCGLNCKKCFAYSRGKIRHHSEKLIELLGSFDRYAERFSKFLPVFSNYPSFKELLTFLSQGSCLGCRRGTCLYPDCGVFLCYKKKRIGFCYECDEFPCDKTNFDPDLKQRWLEMNQRMKEIGVEQYFDEAKDLPRYR